MVTIQARTPAIDAGQHLPVGRGEDVPRRVAGMPPVRNPRLLEMLTILNQLFEDAARRHTR